MLTKDEKKLIKLIKITPLFIIGIVCIIITILLYIEKNSSLNENLKNKEKYTFLYIHQGGVLGNKSMIERYKFKYKI